jgi:hypothetical protein
MQNLPDNSPPEAFTSGQRIFLQALAKTDIREHFFLTGGTALSAFYLQHRFSDALDFFTEEPGQIAPLLPVLQDAAKRLSARLELRRQFASYLEVFLHFPGEAVRCDFAQDSPFRLGPKILRPELGIYTDNELDMACNKLSALFDRADAKDFVDVYFIHREIIPFPTLVREARKKHVGMDNYWLALAFSSVCSISKLPRMIKPVMVDELKVFFSEQAKQLMSGSL